jgi:hypothetical protein
LSTARGTAPEADGPDSEDLDALEARTREQQAAVGEKLNAVVAAGRGDLLRDLFAHYLREVTKDSFVELYEAVVALAGDGAMTGFSWLAQAGPDEFPDRFPVFGFDDATAELVRRIMLLHGPAIRRGTYMAGLEGPDDWDSIVPTISRNVETGEYEFAVAITKHNRETFTVRSDADSLMIWARRMLMMIVAVGDRAAYSDRQIASLLDHMNSVRTFLGRDPAEVANEVKPGDES